MRYNEVTTTLQNYTLARTLTLTHTSTRVSRNTCSQVNQRWSAQPQTQTVIKASLPGVMNDGGIFSDGALPQRTVYSTA